MITTNDIVRRKNLTAASAKWKRRNRKSAWSASVVSNCRARAKRKNVECTITPAYMREITTDRCPVFGTRFVFAGNGGILPSSPSIDRLDPSKGYIEGNVVVISMKANTIKSAYGSKDLYKVADWLWDLGF